MDIGVINTVCVEQYSSEGRLTFHKPDDAVLLSDKQI